MARWRLFVLDLAALVALVFLVSTPVLLVLLTVEVRSLCREAAQLQKEIHQLRTTSPFRGVFP